MYQNEFTLRITSRDSREVITYERCPIFSEYRSQILKRASQLGGIIEPSSCYVTVPNSEALHKLVRYIEKLILPQNTITIEVKGKFFASFPKTSNMETFQEALMVQVSTHNGTKTEDGFSFMSSYDASLFLARIAMNFLA